MTLFYIPMFSCTTVSYCGTNAAKCGNICWIKKKKQKKTSCMLKYSSQTISIPALHDHRAYQPVINTSFNLTINNGGGCIV